MCALGLAATSRAQAVPAAPLFGEQTRFSLADDVPETVYAPPAPPREDQGRNEGAVHFDLSSRYLTAYVWRGIERFEPFDDLQTNFNLQFDTKLSFNVGRYPHPFIALFANIAEDNDSSSFQEIRPTIGADWTIRPFVLSFGHSSYIFPEQDNREDIESSEVFVRLELDDSYFLKTERPVFSPYVLAVYDYDQYSGWYIEGGIKHTIIFEDTPFSLTGEASVAYVNSFGDLFAVPGASDESDSGFQHYQIGVTGNASLNQLLDFSGRFGEWGLQAYVFYTDGIDQNLRGDSILYGGIGIGFHY